MHHHVRLENGRANAAQVYPPELCRAICQGFKAQLEADRRGQFLLAELEESGNGKGKDMADSARKIKEKYLTVEEDDEEEMMDSQVSIA